MEFSEIVEYAKSGLELPKISSQSEHLAYLTVICILEEFRNRTINGAQAKNQKEKAEQLPAQIPQLKKLEVRLNSPSADPTNYEFALICDFEADRLIVYRTYQQNTLKVEELLHEINKELRSQEADKGRVIDLSLHALEVLTGVKFKK